MSKLGGHNGHGPFRGGGVRGLGEKVKGGRSADWQLRNSHGDTKYSTGNTGSNIVITVCGARWALEIPGDTL